MLGGVRVRLGRRRYGPVRSMAVASSLGNATVGCRFGAAMSRSSGLDGNGADLLVSSTSIDHDVGIFIFFLEGKMGSCERDPVDSSIFYFWFLADVLIDYWWAKHSCILPRPNKSYNTLFSFFKFISVFGYIILYTFLCIYCLILGIEDCSTFVDGYDVDSFNHLFDKFIFYFTFSKRKIIKISLKAGPKVYI